MKKVLTGISGLVLILGAVWYTNSAEAESRLQYRFVNISEGDLESVVVSTGNLNAVITVRVGTQISGIVDRIYVDFNDKVHRGQMIARIDTTLLVSSVKDARATLARNQAQLSFSQTEYARIKGLYDKSFITEVELNQAKYNLDLAEATIVSARINLERAQRNLGYATIVSPISGVVVERNVDEGQTVAASLNTPQLFLIANDLSRMEILASVDESDIGLIKEGQVVRFTVQAYDEDIFYGKVRQVRLQSTIQENVVTYTVVVDVDNSDRRLLPGMTSTVEFLIEQVSGILKVPNAALRFRPNELMMSGIQARFESQRGARGDSTRGGGPPGEFRGGRPGVSTGSRSDMATLWFLDENAEIQIARVRTGITDGSQTQVMGRNLEPGMQIISGVSVVESESGFKNPFRSNESSNRRSRFSRGGGF